MQMTVVGVGLLVIFILFGYAGIFLGLLVSTKHFTPFQFIGLALLVLGVLLFLDGKKYG